MILSPKHLPRLASTLGLFTNYGLRDFAKRQGLMSLDGANVLNLRMTNKKGRLLSRPFLFRVRFRPT